MANLQDTTIDDDGFLKLPAGSDAQRPGSPVSGDFRFNTDLGGIEYYTGTEWLAMGLGNADITASVSPQTNGAFSYYPYTSDGTLTVTGSVATVDILIVAAGGGGAADSEAGGGGGAGGVLYAQSYSLPPGEYAVTVGSGGRPNTTIGGSQGEDGENSSLGSFIALGGGGAGDQNTNGRSGGSGGAGGGIDSSEPRTNGGNATQPGNTPAGFVGLGEDGGSCTQPSGDMGGGGGGATQAGFVVTGASYGGGDGGDGVDISNVWSDSYIQNFGDSGVFAGGGGGGSNTGQEGPPGDGGGGRGGLNRNAASGQANTGGGGGGSDGANAGTGGSGFVLVRWGGF